MTTTNTPTSGAADLPDAMHMAELLENPINVVCQKTAAAVLRHQHSEFERLHALAAGQATAAQPYPTPQADRPLRSKEYLAAKYSAAALAARTTADSVLYDPKAALASNGKAPSCESLRTDALCDLSYSRGLKAGWNFCASDDHSGFERAQKIGTEALRALKSPTAQAADSVLEDAARYRWLRRWKGQEHEPPFTVQHEIDGTLWGGDLDAAIDAAMDKGGA